METPKRKKLKHLKQTEKDIIFSVFAFLSTLKLDLGSRSDYKQLEAKYGYTDKVCATACGVSVTTVKRICHERKVNQEQDENSNPATIRNLHRKIDCDGFTVGVIRRVVLNFYANKSYPTVKQVLEECLKDDNFPKISHSTLRKWMVTECSFSFQRLGKKPVFLERSDIAAHRELYLRQSKELRLKGYKFYYTDETWANPDLSPSRCWQTMIQPNERNDFKFYTKNKVLQDYKGNTGGFMVKGGAGRVIINHAGSRDGFLQQAEDIFISKKDSKDYHNSMNSDHFHEWFERVVNAVENKSVIVVDQAPYHKKRVPSTVMPKMHWKKSEIVQSLLDRSIPLPEFVHNFNSLTKRTLLEISDRHPVTTKYIIEEIVERSGKDIIILWTPVAHCELNPIDLVWSVVKRQIAKQNKIGGTQNVYHLAIDVVRNITPELWNSCVDRIIKIEGEMWARDQLVDQTLDEDYDERLIININANDSDCSDSDSD